MSREDIRSDLNQLLADYMVFYQKLRNYHWNVRGQEFFKLHEKFEEGYLQAADWVDDIAERVLALGGTPYSTLRQQTEHARLGEDPEAPSAHQMVRNLIDDIEQLNEWSQDVAEVAEEARDRPTANLLDDIMDMQAERKWMFETFLQD
ncbi:MAG: Dps family protein [Bradymonadaceae bacterium]